MSYLTINSIKKYDGHTVNNQIQPMSKQARKLFNTFCYFFQMNSWIIICGLVCLVVGREQKMAKFNFTDGAKEHSRDGKGKNATNLL